MVCPECLSGDISVLKVRNNVSIYQCNTCGEEFVLEEDIT